MDINLIAAIGKNNELGKNNDLIWRLKEDMKFFKNTTMGHPIVMGRKTFESLPRVLPGRKNIVISTNEIRNDEIELYKSIREFLINYQNFNDDVFIIGGASIYREFIDIATRMYLTEIDAMDNNADVYFPKFNVNDWEREELASNQENSINFKHVLYKRKK
ncbi:MAG: dihydrofolate reductase [Firmicutes bacterium]|nr:dihydrofolate reductase [Bacillota bacterium]